MKARFLFPLCLLALSADAAEPGPPPGLPACPSNEDQPDTTALLHRTEQLMDVVFTVGQYNLVSWALNSFGVPLDDFLPGAKKGET